MSYIDINTVKTDMWSIIGDVVENPVFTEGDNEHSFHVYGGWKRHAPYQIILSVRADTLGGVEVTAGIRSFYGLYNRGLRPQIATQVRYDNPGISWAYELRSACKYMIKLLGANAALTYTPPKGLSDAELLSWTMHYAGVDEDTAREVVAA